MTYVLAWCLCSICSYLLGKSHIENLFRPFGGLVSTCINVWLSDPEIPDDEKWQLQKTPEGFIGAILWTLLLIICLALWPVVVLLLLYGKVTGYRVTKEDLEG